MAAVVGAQLFLSVNDMKWLYKLTVRDPREERLLPVSENSVLGSSTAQKQQLSAL
jgi:hypothetical protein